MAFGANGVGEIHFVVFKVLLRIDLGEIIRPGSEVPVTPGAQFETGGDEHWRGHLAVCDMAADGLVATLAADTDMAAFLPKIVLFNWWRQAVSRKKIGQKCSGTRAGDGFGGRGKGFGCKDGSQKIGFGRCRHHLSGLGQILWSDEPTYEWNSGV